MRHYVYIISWWSVHRLTCSQLVYFGAASYHSCTQQRPRTTVWLMTMQPHLRQISQMTQRMIAKRQTSQTCDTVNTLSETNVKNDWFKQDLPHGRSRMQHVCCMSSIAMFGRAKVSVQYLTQKVATLAIFVFARVTRMHLARMARLIYRVSWWLWLSSSWVRTSINILHLRNLNGATCITLDWSL